jgi:hypothetical protein
MIADVSQNAHDAFTVKDSDLDAPSFHIVRKSNYDKTINFGKIQINAYSKKAMNAHFGNLDNVSIVGEACKQKKHNAFAKLQLGNTQNEPAQTLRVMPQGTLGKLLYKRVGWVQVMGDVALDAAAKVDHNVSPSTSDVAGLAGESGMHFVALCKSRLAFLLWVLALVAAIIIAVAFVVSILVSPVVIKPLNKLPDVDSNAISVEPEGTTADTSGSSVSLAYSLDASLNLDTGQIDMYFKNPSTSNRDVLVELCVQDGNKDVIVAKSGLIEPSSELTRMCFDANSAKLSAGVYDAKFKVLFYDPSTGEKALVESDIDDVELTASK